MRTVDVDRGIQAAPELSALVRRANEFLESQLGRSSKLVSATWRLLRDDRESSHVRLEVSDQTGRVEAVFTPDDLKNEWQMQGRIIRLWGDLLQIRSHREIEELLGVPTAAEGV